MEYFAGIPAALIVCFQDLADKKVQLAKSLKSTT
jgi:hypothetical protein